MRKPQRVPTVVTESHVNVKLKLYTDQSRAAGRPLTVFSKPAASVGGLASLRIFPSNELQPQLWAGPQNSLWPPPTAAGIPGGLKAGYITGIRCCLITSLGTCGQWRCELNGATQKVCQAGVYLLQS